MAITNSDGSIVLTTSVDQSGLKKGMSTMKSGVSSLVSSFGKLASAIGVAFSVGALIKFSKESSNLATASEASVQRLIDIYGVASKSVGDFIDANARALGISRTAAATYASVYGNLFSVWADQQTNAELTAKYLNMTAVVASKTGRSVQDVQERVRSGLLGNTEAIEDLGIFVNVKTIEMTDAFQRMANGRSWEQLDAFTQQQIRSMAILEQATSKYGDEVAKTSSLTKSQFKAAYEDFQATWGRVVNRVLVPVLGVLTDIINKSTIVMQSLFGISSETISEADLIGGAVEKQDELTESVKETEKAVKKSLAGFDDLQIISSKTSENLENSSNGISFDTIGGGQNGQASQKENLGIFERIAEKVKEIANLFNSGFWSRFQQSDFSGVISSFKNMVAPIRELVDKYFPQLSQFGDFLVVQFGAVVGSLAKTMATAFSSLFDVLASVFSVVNDFFPEILELKEFLALTFVDIFTNVLDFASDTMNSVSQVYIKFVEILRSCMPSVLAFSTSVVETFGTIANSVVGVAKTIAGNLIGGVSEYLDVNKDFIQKKIGGILDASAEATSSFGRLFSAFSSMFSNTFGGERAKKLSADILKIFLNPAISIVELATRIGSDFINGLSNAIVKNQSGLTRVTSGILSVFSSITSKVGEIIDIVSAKMDYIYTENLKPLISVIGETVSQWVATFTSAWSEHIQPVLDAFAEKFGVVVDNHVKPAIDKIVAFVGKLIDAIKSLWEKWLAPAVNWLIEVLSPVFGAIFENIGNAINNVIATISDAVGGIFDAFGGIIDFIVGVFSGDWKAAWEGVRAIFVGIWNALYATVKSPLNLIIDAVNKLIDGLNKVSFNIPNWSILGDWAGKNFGINIPKIPKLAQGAVIPPNKEFLAVLGDQQSGTNIETPLQTMVDAFKIALAENAGGGKTEVVLEIDGREFGRAVVEQGNRESRRIGTRLVIA